MTERQLGAYTVPTRLYLTLEQRLKLEHLVHEQRADLAELISTIVVEYLDQLPADPAPAPEPPANRAEELRTRRAELARLRARRDTAGSAAPAWLHSYIADLEGDIRRLER